MPSPSTLLRLAGPLALGLYVGRVAGELWAASQGDTTPLLAALLTLLGTGGTLLLNWRTRAHTTWPLLILLIYVFYPSASATAALATAAVALLVLWQTVQRPLASPRIPQQTILAAAIVGLAFFVLYSATLAPDILPADSGEFQVVATNLGVAHPPGFPLYTVLAHLMTRLPVGPTPAYRVNLFSAVTSALTLAVLFLTANKLTGRRIAGFLAVIALGSATTFWAQATTANIRSMTALFTALILYSVISYYGFVLRGQSHDRAAGRWLALFALFAALGITHHASLVFLCLVAGLFLLLADPALRRPSRRWLVGCLAFAAGLLPLLYLPLRANAGTRGTTPDLATWSGFVEHALATGFRGDLFVYLQPTLFIERVRVMGNVLTFQFAPLLLAGMLLGLILAARRDWRIGLLLGGTTAIFVLVTATYRAPQTVEYMLPAYVALSLLLAPAVVELGSGARSGAIHAVVLAVLLVSAGWQMARTYPSYALLHGNWDTRTYAQDLLAAAPEEALALADWHWATALWYLQEVEGVRPDVAAQFVFPEGEPYGETWVKRIGEGLSDGRAVISTHFDPDTYQQLPVSEPLGEAFLFPAVDRTSLPDAYVPIEQLLGGTLQINGYTLNAAQHGIDSEIVLSLAWQTLDVLPPGTSLFVHLLDADGRLVGQQDLPARPRPTGLTLSQFRITPLAGTVPGDYNLSVGAYAANPLLNQDGLPRTTLTTITITLAASHPPTGNPRRTVLVNEANRSLVGYDWDHTLAGRPRLYLHWQLADGFETQVSDGGTPSLPPFVGPWGVASSRWSLTDTRTNSHYVPLGKGIAWMGQGLGAQDTAAPGTTITLRQRFLSSRPVLRDQTVSVRLIGYEPGTEQWSWWDLNDAIPAMGAIPTLKWIEGSRVVSPHFVTVSPDAQPDQELGGALLLYDAFTARPLSILDDRLVTEYGLIPLGSGNVSE